MAQSDLLSKTEQALAAYETTILAAAAITASVYTGENNTDNTDKTPPAVVCQADTAPEEDPPLTGNFWVFATVMVKSIAAVDSGEVAADIKAAHDLLVKAVFDPLVSDDLPTQLSTQIAAFTCQAALYDSLNNATDQDVFVTSIRLKLYCCASDL